MLRGERALGSKIEAKEAGLAEGECPEVRKVGTWPDGRREPTEVSKPPRARRKSLEGVSTHNRRKRPPRGKRRDGDRRELVGGRPPFCAGPLVGFPDSLAWDPRSLKIRFAGWPASKGLAPRPRPSFYAA